MLTQPLLRGFGPNADATTTCATAGAAASRQERALELARQRVAVEVTRAFYQVHRSSASSSPWRARA